MRNHKQCFVNAHCSIDCPNFQFDIADERYGYGIAEDMGLERISCKECFYNTGKSDDCLFFKECDSNGQFKIKTRTRHFGQA